MEDHNETNNNNNNNNNNIDASLTTTTTILSPGMLVDHPQQPLPHHLVAQGPSVDAANAAVAPADTATTAQHPRKKQKVRRKPPPAEPIRTQHLPEESKLQTPVNTGTSLHGSGLLSETRLMSHRTAQTAPRQTQFIFSPRPPPMAPNDMVPGETARLPRSDSDILHRLRPIEHNEPSIYYSSASRHPMNETDNNSVSELVASLPMRSSLHYASMSTSSPPPRRLEEMNYRFHLGAASRHSPFLLNTMVPPQHLGATPQSRLLPNTTMAPPPQLNRAGGFSPTPDALRSLVLGSVSSRANAFAAQRSNTHFALAAAQTMRLPNNSSPITGTTTALSFPPPTRNANQILQDMLRQQQQQVTHHDPVMDALVAAGGTMESAASTTTEEQRSSVSPRTSSTIAPLRLPAIMGHSSDILQMNDHQAFLRQQIEVFQATQEDLYANTRGRNKRIHVGQVGIRCRHCAHIAPRQRQKGTVYFPATMRGLYQAAQNMSTNHIQCGLCTEMPEDVKAKFVELWPTKNRVSRAGAGYWEEAARRLGLVDTEDGIAFQPNPPGP